MSKRKAGKSRLVDVLEFQGFDGKGTRVVKSVVEQTEAAGDLFALAVGKAEAVYRGNEAIPVKLKRIAAIFSACLEGDAAIANPKAVDAVESARAVKPNRRDPRNYTVAQWAIALRTGGTAKLAAGADRGA